MEITGMNSGFSNMRLRLHVLLQQLYRGPRKMESIAERT